MKKSIASQPILSTLALAAAASACAAEPVIGLITKTETNPFFVKMKEGASEAAKAKGAKTILITPSDSKAIVPAIKKARDKGVLVIALASSPAATPTPASR